MGSPAHVRNDFLAFTTRLSRDRRDIGSRFERIAALAFGRLGVPGPDRDVQRGSLRSFFTNDRSTGLADLVHGSYFSHSTLPRPIELPLGRDDRDRDLNTEIDRALRLPRPAPNGSLLDLVAARTRAVALTGPNGECLARYRVVGITLEFSTDDECDLEQVRRLLPLTASYSTGLLNYLFRGTLAVEPGNRLVVKNAGADLGKGTMTVLWEDARGVRTAVGDAVPSSGARGDAVVAQVGGVPKGARRVVALFRGVDASGAPVIATGFAALDGKRK